jgi:hypothetical protein
MPPQIVGCPLAQPVLLALLATTVIALAGCAPAAVSSARPAPTRARASLRVEEPDLHFTKYACRDAGKDPCRGLADSAGDGKVTSNLAGDGTSHFDLIVDDSDPGPNGDCNTVHESTTFTFALGTISVASLHRDCNFGGVRIETLFVITGGTGAFAGATGYGTESDANGITYDATIAYMPGPASSQATAFLAQRSR